MKMKQCTKCDYPKPLEEFTKDSRSSDGRRSMCKFHSSEANKAYMKKWRAKKKLQAEKKIDIWAVVAWP